MGQKYYSFNDYSIVKLVIMISGYHHGIEYNIGELKKDCICFSHSCLYGTVEIVKGIFIF